MMSSTLPQAVAIFELRLMGNITLQHSLHKFLDASIRRCRSFDYFSIFSYHTDSEIIVRIAILHFQPKIRLDNLFSIWTRILYSFFSLPGMRIHRATWNEFGGYQLWVDARVSRLSYEELVAKITPVVSYTISTVQIPYHA